MTHAHVSINSVGKQARPREKESKRDRKKEDTAGVALSPHCIQGGVVVLTIKPKRSERVGDES